MSSVPSVSSVAASVFGTGSASASITSSDWFDPSATGGSSGFLDSSSTTTSNADAYLAADSALSSALSDTLSNNIQGQATLAGQAALDRVNAAIKHKQASASAPSASATSFNGFTTVQNLMKAFDNITINGGSNASSTAGKAPATGQSLLQSIDALLAKPPTVNVTA